MSGPVSLPISVILPTTVEIDAGTLSEALDSASKQKLSLWRSNYGFPASIPRGNTTITKTASLAAWLTARGVKVTWV